MTSATFRWRPGWVFAAPALVALPLLVGIILLTKIWTLFAMLPVMAVILSSLRATFRYGLTLDEHGVTLLRVDQQRWTIPWTDLQEVTYQHGSLFAKNWDRLILRTPAGVKNLTLDDRLSGRWSDPEAIKGILRARGYAL